MTDRLRVAVIGVGYLGRFHAQKYAQMEDVELVAVVDSSPSRARQVAAETNTAALTDIGELAGRIDAASVVVPTVSHYEVASRLLRDHVHLMVEKPVTTTVKEADELIDLARRNGLVLQVGHLERFNPAVEVLEERVVKPVFIEAHRLSVFKERALDVDVVLDLMIHDLDIVLSIVKAPVREIRAAGVPVLTPKVDIANVRIIFEDGCTANLTASRISLQDMRRIRVFQPGIYISADCTSRKNLIVTRNQNAPGMSGIHPEFIDHEGTDVLFDELNAFIKCVRLGDVPRVSGEAARDALALALDINHAIKHSLETADLKSVL